MKLRITVHGVAYEVDVEVLDAGEGFPANPLPRVSQPAAQAAPQSAPVQALRVQKPAAPGTQNVSPGGAITSPIAGNVLEIKCKPGDSVKKNQAVLIIEAMKMETTISAPADGVIKSVDIAVGDAVRENQVLVQFE